MRSNHDHAVVAQIFYYTTLGILYIYVYEYFAVSHTPHAIPQEPAPLQ